MTNRDEPSRANAKARHELKKALFKRQGWKENEQWFAMCAFGCGVKISWGSATIDRHPTPGRFGGKYELSNTRLTCGPCNWSDGGRSSAALSRALDKKQKGEPLSPEQEELLSKYVPNGSRPKARVRKRRRENSPVVINREEHLIQHIRIENAESITLRTEINQD